MDISKENILIFTRTTGQGGTENIVLELCEILNPLAGKIVVCSRGGINEAVLKEMGIRHVTVPDIAERSPKKMLSVVKILRKTVKEEKITVIHSHHRMAAFYARFSGGKVIRLANAHNTFTDKKKLTRFAYKNTKIIAVGEQVKRNLSDTFGIPEENITVIKNAVKPFNRKIFEIPEFKEAKEEGCILIGNIGRISEQKGMEYFIKAAQILYSKEPRARFYIIGSGEDEEKLKGFAAGHLPEGIVSFMGYREDIQNIISQLDFIVLSSLWEGFPLTPIETFSAGKTIAATDVDGTSEIVKDGVNGLLVRPKDIQGLAAAMERLCSDTKLKENLEKNAAESFEKEFSFENFAKQYIRFYEAL